MELEGGRRDYVRKPEVEDNARRAQASEQKPGRAERGQPSNVFCYKGSTYLLMRMLRAVDESHRYAKQED